MSIHALWSVSLVKTQRKKQKQNIKNEYNI